MKRKDLTKKIICFITLSGLTIPALFSVLPKNALASSYEAQSRLDELKKQSEENERAIQDAEAKKKAAEAAIAKEKDSALRLFKNGASYELVRASIVSLSDEELQTIYKEATEN